jgi:hypothetical protein
MGVEQHLMGLQGIGAQKEGPAVRQLDMGNLELYALAADNRKVLAPVELERLPGRNDSGTNVPRPVVCCSRCRSARQFRAKAATRP